MTTEPLATFAAAEKYLDDLQMHKIKLGLAAMRQVLAALGSPEKACPAVHVAGTNGKGSTCAILQNILHRAGLRVGLYTSPHLDSVRERFRINDHFISKDDFTHHLERIRSTCAGTSMTYFECATALAFSWFAAQQCELVIIETGMGGRLDATNVLTPLITIITSISLDHQQYLGNTLAAVAFEKAGIIKPQVPLISGVTASAAQKLIRRVASEQAAPLQEVNSHFKIEKQPADGSWSFVAGSEQLADIRIERPGRWQHDNAACAIAAALMLRERGYEVTDEAIRSGVKNAHWPGRMEYIELSQAGDRRFRFLLDGAHNDEGIDHLLASIEGEFDYQRLFVIWASMADKNVAPMVRRVAQQADHLILTAPDSERSARPQDLFAVLPAELKERAVVTSTVISALEQVYATTTNDDLIVVAGSLYLVGELRKALVGEVVNE